MKVGELCAGYGGISMGLRLAGEEVDLRWLAEFDAALDVLHPTGVPNLGDITEVAWSNVEPVDLLTAGFPCQPFSAAGSQLAEADPRYLWPAVRYAVAALLPPRVLLENVRNLVSMRKGEIWARILDDLTSLGYDVTWLTLGACAIGAAHHRHRVFALGVHKGARWSTATHGRLNVHECGAKAPLLPSPSASSYGSNQGGAAGRVGPVRHSLDSMARLDLLPTVTSRDGSSGPGHTGSAEGSPDLRTAVTLLPTPAARDGASRGVLSQGQRKSPNLGTELALLPTPAAADSERGSMTYPRRGDNFTMLGAIQPINFDRFQGAVDRHAAIFGPPPAPTEPNRNGAPRLSAAFAEWLMCVPTGHVTDALPRNAALKAIGNGVCPPQLAAAWRLLTGVDKPNDTSIGFGAMTTSTSADVKEIQDRNAAARGRVIEATMALGVTVDPALIQAAMMELAAVWREEAAHVTAAKRKGHVSIAKEYTQAAARLAGFAVGLTTRPISEVVPTPPGRMLDAQAQAEDWYGGDEPHPPQCDCGRPECVALSLAEALPKDDPVAAVFTSPGQTDPDSSYGGDTPLSDLFDATSEENALRDIIGPLGASSVTATIDHPFTNPGIPWLNKVRAVEIIPYAQLPVIAAATPPRDHVSHSYVESYEGCSLSAMLRDASRAGHIGASRPSWSMIGGTAFHSAVEQIERLAVSGVTFVGPDEALWMEHFDAAVKEHMDALVGTPYADSATWYISNRGKEGFDWWRVEGAKMLGLYVKHHTSEWRAANQTFLLQDKTPVIELPYTMSIRSLDGERGLTAQGFVDRATLDMSTYSLTVLDYKTGSREPESTFQLGEYGHALLMAMGIPDEPPDRPILGRYWLARKGIYTDAVPVVTRHPLQELQYRYDAADRGQRARIFSPHVTNLCKSCSVVDYCPTQAGRS